MNPDDWRPKPGGGEPDLCQQCGDHHDPGHDCTTDPYNDDSDSGEVA